MDSNPGSDERQLAVSGNTLDHTAIRVGLIKVKSLLASCKWWREPESQVKTIARPQVTGNFLTWHKLDSNQKEVRAFDQNPQREREVCIKYYIIFM